jgi:2-aminoethylphosphonate dioxygenase
VCVSPLSCTRDNGPNLSSYASPHAQYLILPPISSQVSDNIVQWTKEVKVRTHLRLHRYPHPWPIITSQLPKPHQNLPHHPSAQWMHYEEVTPTGQRILCRTENFADHHDGFNTLFRGRGILDILEELSGEEMVLFKEKINYKASNAGGFRPHVSDILNLSSACKMITRFSLA